MPCPAFTCLVWFRQCYSISCKSVGSREIYEQTYDRQRLVGGKYFWLAENNIIRTQWVLLSPQSPFYLFTLHNIDLLTKYERGWRVIDIMPVNSTGVKTHRDHFVLDFDRSSLRRRIEDFRNVIIRRKYLRLHVCCLPLTDLSCAICWFSQDRFSTLAPYFECRSVS